MKTFFIILSGGMIRQVTGRKMVARYQEPTLIYADDDMKDLVAVVPSTALVFSEVVDPDTQTTAPKRNPNQDELPF